jgi:hypothetical protein
MENARNYIFVNYMRATEIETKGTSCPSTSPIAVSSPYISMPKIG